MLKCSHCDGDINIENNIYRCCDGTVCSKKCQLDRCIKIQSKDIMLSNFTSWEKTTSYLIDPKKTMKEMRKCATFVPIYVNSESDLKKTISKYILDNFTNDNHCNITSVISNNTKKYTHCYKNNKYSNNFAKNTEKLNIVDNSYNLLHNGVSKLCNIINKII